MDISTNSSFIMPRPRFAKLDPLRRDAILDAAAAEFGASGLGGASYNRIIERAGLSKGAMYYYFDDKEDLLATVCADVLGRFEGVLGGLPAPGNADEYWAALAEQYVAVVGHLATQPRLAAFAPALMQLWRAPDKPAALCELEASLRKWLGDLLAIGREVGAVRNDLPDDLLLPLGMALGEAIDLWIVKQVREGGLTDPQAGVELAVGLWRRLLEAH